MSMMTTQKFLKANQKHNPLGCYRICKSCGEEWNVSGAYKELPKPNNKQLFGVMPSGKSRTWEDTYSRSPKERSKTFPGIAKAMAEQWAGKA